MSRDPDNAWEGDSTALLERLRPVRLRWDIALVASSIALGLCLVWAAHALRPRDRPLPFEFQRDGETIYTLDRLNGTVAVCRAAGDGMICEADSAFAAERRALREIDEEIDGSTVEP